MKHYFYGFALSAFLAAGSAQSATFGADTASASSEFSGSFVAENTINGSGLSSAGDPNASHADYVGGNHWTTRRSDTVGAFIEWGFAGPVDLGGLYIWTHRSNVIASNAFYEPTLFDLTFFDLADVALATFTDVDLAPDTDLSQSFTLSSVLTGVSSVRFTVKETQGSTPFTGLGEVLFDDAIITSNGTTVLDAAPAVPLPAGLPLMLAGLGAFAVMRRARQS